MFLSVNSMASVHSLKKSIHFVLTGCEWSIIHLGHPGTLKKVNFALTFM